MGPILQHWHEIAYGVLAVIFIVIYVTHLLPIGKESKIKSLVLNVESLLIVILIFIAILALRVENMSRNITGQTGEIAKALEDVLKAEGLAKVHPIDNLDQLFGELNAARYRTKREIRMLRLWGDSPKDLIARSRQAGVWYGGMDQWLNGSSGRVLLRIFGVHDQDTEEAFREQCRQTSGSGNNVIRMANGTMQDPDLNIVTFDRREVFLVVSPSGELIEATKTYHIEDPGLADFLANMYEQLFARATPCPK